MDVKSSSIVKIYLKQQTPMIHFQHSEAGATLRATEVKPKLDKFILKHVGDIPDKWYIDKDKNNALNYKMRIVAKGEPVRSKEIEAAHKSIDICGKTNCKGVEVENPICKSYFGNMVTKEDDRKLYKQNVSENYKETVFYHKEIELTIFCIIEPLRNKINELIPAFFLLHNFGTRQNKGFGSFKVSLRNGRPLRDDVKTIISKYAPNSFYIKQSIYFASEGSFKKEKIKSNKQGYEYALDDINMVYGFMKGGYNLTKKWNGKLKKMVPSDSPDDYFRGYIYRYFMKEENGKFSNDKAFIKQKILVKEHENDEFGEKKEIGADYKFVRAMLGLPGFLKFSHVGRNHIIIYNYNKNGIERFQSPILFKVVDDYIFIIPKEVDDKMKETSFYFSKLNVKSEEYQPEDKEKIVTPKFDTSDFLKKFVEDFSLKDEKKGGTIGINKAKNFALRRAKDLEIKSIRGEKDE